MGDHQDIDHSGLTGVGDVAAHEADTTAVHGIADTSTLYKAGGTDVAVADGGTGSSTAAAARTALGAAAVLDVTDHTGDATDAHDASAISFVPDGSIAATNVQAAIVEVRDEAASGSGIPATIVDAKGDSIWASAADTVVRVAAGSDGQGLIYRAGATAGVEPVEVLPWHVDVFPESEPDVTINTWGLVSHTGANYANGGTGVTNGLGTPAVNDEIAWDVVLAQGTWNVTLHHRKSTNVGIYTVSIDASSIGTIDGYAAAAAAAKDTISAVAIATTGKKRLKFKMATKNASSSDYVATIQAVSLRRTA